MPEEVLEKNSVSLLRVKFFEKIAKQMSVFSGDLKFLFCLFLFDL